MNEKAGLGFFVAGILVLSTFGMSMGLGFSGSAEAVETGSEVVSDVGRCGMGMDGISDQNESSESHHRLEIKIEGEGSTEPEEGVHEYVEGDEVTVKAFPEKGYVFTGWEGDHDGTEDEIAITMDENKSLTAHFVEGLELIIHVEGEGDVEVQGEKVGLPYTGHFEEDEDVEVTAIPGIGFEFEEWTGDHVGGEKDIVVTMDEEKVITAHFEDVRKRIYDWHDLHEVREDLKGDYVLAQDLDEDTDGYEEYNNQTVNYEIREYESEEWGQGDTIEIPFDEDNYDSVLSVEDEDGNPINHNVDHPTITIDENTGKTYVYVTYENAIVGWGTDR